MNEREKLSELKDKALIRLQNISHGNVASNEAALYCQIDACRTILNFWESQYGRVLPN